MNKEEYKAHFRQRLNEEDSDDAQIANHPHGALTGVLAHHLGVDSDKVFETTSALTTDSPEEHIDNAIGDVISEHGDRMFSKLSAEPDDPYYTPPSRYRDRMKRYRGEYLLGPDDRDAADVASNKQYDRFVADLTDHIHNNTSTGVHTEFTGTPRYDGVDEVI